VRFGVVVVFLGCFDTNDVVGEGHILGVGFDGFAAMLADESPSRGTYGKVPVDVVEGEEEGSTDETLDEAWEEIGDSHYDRWQ